MFDEYLWIYIKSFLFDKTDIQRRIRHNKENIRFKLFWSKFDRPSIYDIYDKIMSENFDDDYAQLF